MKRVFISTSTFGEQSMEPLEILKSKRYRIQLNPYGRQLQQHECMELYKNFDGIIAGTEKFDDKILNAATNLKVISRVGVGLDNIDIKVAQGRGIRVYTTNIELSIAVAELTLGLILDLLRGISNQNLRVKSGIWKKEMGSLLSGKTLGIIGLGKVGKTLIKLTQGFSLSYLACDIVEDNKFGKKYNVKFVELNELLMSSDIVSIHLSYTPDLINTISFQQFKIMKNDAIIVNTSRGEIINEFDLEKAILKGEIAGAALDVYKKEPYNGPLTNYENIILTPHIGSYAKEIRIRMEFDAVNNLIKGFGESI